MFTLNYLHFCYLKSILIFKRHVNSYRPQILQSVLQLTKKKRPSDAHTLAAGTAQPAAEPPGNVADDQRDLPAATSCYDQRAADELVETARRLGQQLEYHAITRGDGNCFYHAVLEQVRNRPEVSRLIPLEVLESGALTDHLSLRQAVVCYVRRAVDPVFLGKTRGEFDEWLHHQALPAVFAEDIVVQSAATYLGVDIWLISDQNTPEAPYTKMDGGHVAGVHIILGYKPQVHFQSLYRVTETEVSLPAGAPPSKKARLSDAERKRLARAVESEAKQAARLESNARRMVEQRESETPGERQERLAAKALHASQTKQAETVAERQRRLAAEALHKSQAKQAETVAERQRRLAAEALHKAQAKQAETVAERQRRLATEALHKAQAKQAESVAERQRRLAAEALHKKQVEQAESVAERQRRLAAKALHQAQAKQAESVVERQRRLAADALQKAQARQAETDAQRDERLAAASEAMSQLRESRRRQAATEQDVTETADNAGPELSQAMSQSSENTLGQTSTASDAAAPAEAARPEFWEHGEKFHTAMDGREYRVCFRCSELRYVDTDNSDAPYECKRCSKDPVSFSAENDMDPGPVPDELAGLTQIEEMLISQFLPMMTVYRLPRGGQHGYSGNVINLPQDVQQLVQSLPRRTTDTAIFVIRKQLDDNTHRDFRVRRNVVHRALLWLKENNEDYANIDINDDNLQLLPEDDFVDVRSYDAPNVECDVPSSSTPTDAAPCDDDTQAEMHSTFLPLNVARATEAETVEENLNPVQWPRVSDRPVNEFETSGYVTKCFPTLLPTGAAELRRTRDKWVGEAAYFKHLLLYKDQRFAQHPRFRYFAYNTLIRHRALATGRMYLRQRHDSAALSLEEIRQLSETERRRLAHDVVRFGAHLRGSPQFWRSQRQSLMALIDQLGTPHCYFTLSSADMQWPDLQAYLHQFGGVQSPSAAVASNPMLCTWFMFERVSTFLETFLYDELHIQDYWSRFEWQHRGSLHMHGVGYMRDGKDVAEVIRLADTFPDRLREYVDRLVTAWHPSPPVPGRPIVPPVQHPCAKRFKDVSDCESDYESLLNSVQRHTRCSAGYCLRKKRGHDVAECRFGYPKDLADTTTVTVKRSQNDKVEVTVEPRRNDPLLNCHNRALLQAWRANVDFQLVHDRTKVVEYLAKYISKSEPRSQDLKDLLDAAVSITDETSDRATTTAIQRLLVKAVCERDICAQEVCHHLLELPLVICNRQFHILAVDGGVDADGRLTVDRELVSGGRVSKCDLEKYVARDPERETLSMVEYFRKHYRTRRAGRGEEYDAVRRKELIVRVIPRLLACPCDPEKHARFCRQQLMLHKPFRRVSELTEGFADAVEAYNAWIRSRQVCVTDIEAEVADYREDAEYDPVDPDDGAEEQRREEAWVVACRYYFPYIRLREGDNRPVYEQYADYDWTAAAASYDVATASTFVGDHRQMAAAVSDIPVVSPDTLVGNQRVAFELVASHADRNDAEPIRAIISGTAGTGKSHLINALRSRLGDRRCKVVAPTGVAAFNVSGSTIHHMFHLPVQKATDRFIPSDRCFAAKLAG